MKDSFGEILRITKKPIKISNIKIPVGSSYGYVVQDGAVETFFKNKTNAIRDYRASKHHFAELSVSEVYFTPQGQLLDIMVLEGN
jgi:hypothetical protein